MPNIDELSIQFSSKGTSTAVKNIKDMGYAVRGLAESLKAIDTSKLGAFKSAMSELKKSTPTATQTNRMVAFSDAIKELSSAIGTANISSFSRDMSTLGGAVETFKRSSVNSIQNAVTAMQNLGTTAQQTASTINNSVTKNTPKVSMGDAKGNLANTQELIASLDKVEVKAKGVTGILQKMGIYTPTKPFKALADNAEKIRQKYEQLRATIQKGLNEGSITSGDSTYKKKMAELDALRNKYDELILKQRELAQEGKGFSISPNLKNAYAGVKDTVSGVKKAFGGISSVIGTANKYINSFIGKLRSLGHSSKSAKKDTSSLTEVTKKLGNELFRVSKMLKLMIVRKALRAVIAEVGNGFQSLAIHSDEFNNAMSSLINGSKTLGYSFSAMVSPLINALAPAIVYIINLLTKLANAFNQVMSAITGASTWNKAKAFTDSWRDSIEGAGSAAKKTAKELKKTVLGFDELNQLQDNKDSSSGGGSGIKDMFDTLPIESKWKDLADKIKALAQRLFEPIKKAWDKVGDFVKKSWKYAMDEVIKLGKSVARDFLKVWEQEATQKIFENIFEAVGWIGVAVGNLAKRFREAWDENNTGLHILEAIRDIILVISEHIKNMAKATAEWADNLDFRPLLTSIQGWLQSLKPAVDAVMGILEDFYSQVVLKFTEWVIESGLPELINVFKRFNEEVKWDQLRERLSKLWEHLEPFMETIGEGLIIFIERVTTALADFINGDEFASFLERLEKWMDSVTPEDVADAIEKLVKAIVALKVAQTVIPILSGLASVLGSLSAVAGGAVLALKGILVVGTALAGLEIGKWLGSLFDPETYAGYEGVIGSIKMIGDTFIAVRDGIEMAVEDIKRLWHAFWGDTEKAQRDGNSALERLGNTTTSVIVNPFKLAKYLLVGDPIVIDMWNDISKAFTDGKEAIGRIVTDLKNSIVRVFTDIKSSVDSKVAEIKTKLDEWKNKFAETKENIGTSLNTIKENAVSKFNEVKTSLSNFKDEWVSKWEENKKKLSDFKTEGGRLLSDIKKDFTDIFGDIRKSMDKNEWTFEGVGEGLKSTFEKAKNGIKGVWNSIAETLNGDHEIGGSSLHIRLPKFAQGGFVEDGLFLMNHHELVGQFSNGKTAVANNGQIIEGISAGVYNAFAKAASSNNSGSKYISNEIIVDGEVIARTVTKAQEKQNRRYSPAY